MMFDRSTALAAVCCFVLLSWPTHTSASPLHDAAANNDVLRLKELLDSKKYPVNGLNAAGQTPLAQAYATCSNCTRRFPKAVPNAQLQFCEPGINGATAALLICAGADVNADVFGSARPGYSIMHLVSCHGALGLRDLIAAGARLNAEYQLPDSGKRVTPLAWAKMCASKKWNNTEYGDPEYHIKDLSEAGARLEPNTPNPQEARDKPTWLQRGKALACDSANDSVKWMTVARKEADEDAAYARNYPLHVAVVANDLPKVKALIEGGRVGVDAKDDKGFTPLQRGFDCCRACSWCWPQIDGPTAAYLVSKGANVKLDFVSRGEILEKGYTLLHKASFHAKTDLVKALLAGGADPNAVFYSDDGTGVKRPITPLIRAAYCDFRLSTSDEAAFQALLDAGAKPFAPGSNKPMTYAFSVPKELEKCKAVGACTEAEVEANMHKFVTGQCGSAWRVVWNALNKPGGKAGAAPAGGAAKAAGGRRMFAA